ncbi:MAG: hypothetical protein EZS28_044161 [Streblomastix strix]|uniref:Uncharacterized protein n=1 Tax=Streblomastix strix TaxID=222440 RepID=A0A5J4TQZ9_9EUKA|nr:MAG: hypothetical protein EZS28_044161 [Streblomastix strix]
MWSTLEFQSTVLQLLSQFLEVLFYEYSVSIVLLAKADYRPVFGFHHSRQRFLIPQVMQMMVLDEIVMEVGAIQIAYGMITYEISQKIESSLSFSLLVAFEILPMVR